MTRKLPEKEGELACPPSLLERSAYRSRFPTFDAWLAYDWHEHIKEARITVEVELMIRRFGLLLENPPSQGE